MDWETSILVQNLLGEEITLGEQLATFFDSKSSDVVYKIRPHNPIYLDESADLNFDTNVDPWIKDRVDADMICQYLNRFCLGGNNYGTPGQMIGFSEQPSCTLMDGSDSCRFK